MPNFNDLIPSGPNYLTQNSMRLNRSVGLTYFDLLAAGYDPDCDEKIAPHLKVNNDKADPPLSRWCHDEGYYLMTGSKLQDIAKEMGVDRSTLYRWSKGSSVEQPRKRKKYQRKK